MERESSNRHPNETKRRARLNRRDALKTMASTGLFASTGLATTVSTAGAATELFAEEFADGVSAWTASSRSLDQWSTETAANGDTIVTTDTRGTSSTYIGYADPPSLPSEYELSVRVRVDAANSNATYPPGISVLTDWADVSALRENNFAGVIEGKSAPLTAAVERPKTNGICTGDLEVSAGEWHDVVIRRANDIYVFAVDGQVAGAFDAVDLGGTIGLGVYEMQASFESVTLTALDGVPADHPTSAYGCGDPSGGEPDRSLETIVDNNDATVTTTGHWSVSSWEPDRIGSNYLHDGNSGKDEKAVEYAPDLSVGSEYEVYCYWNESNDRATNVPIDIAYNGGTETVTVDQTRNGARWNKIGKYSFASGSGESVTIRNDGTTDYVIADAVQFVPVVLDSEETVGVQTLGDWKSSSWDSGFVGEGYEHDGNASKGEKTVEFSPVFPVEGQYRIWMNWTASDNRASNVPVDVNHEGCLTTMTIDQTENGGQWNEIGTYAFSKGSGTIRIRNDGTEGYVVADAIRVELVGASGSSLPGVVVNQSGYNRNRPKRFTAPNVPDRTTFKVAPAKSAGTCSVATGETRFEGKVTGSVGDLTDFDPDDPGPYVIAVDDDGVTHTSDPFLIDDHLTERASYRNAVEFFTGSRTGFGDFQEALPFDNRGIAWRDSDSYSFIIPTLIDLYKSNPSAMEDIVIGPEDEPNDLPAGSYDYDGVPSALPADTPEVVRLIHWGVEVYLGSEVNVALPKAELAAFLEAYPLLSEWIPRDLYERTLEYLFPIWDQNVPVDEENRFYVDAYYGGPYTAYSDDLLTTYEKVGASKGEFPPGFSIRANLEMYEVAMREGRDDVERYLQAAEDQARWIVESLDPADPAVTKGQRQGEHVTVPSMARLLEATPERAPGGTRAWIRDWAEVMLSRSDNMWDFRKWDQDTWIDWNLPSYPGILNEPGNVAGFPAPATAAARVLDGDDPELADGMRRIAQSHVDNTFGRNPTHRHFCHRATTDVYGFEGADRGWYSEHDGIGQLIGVVGVLDGSPKPHHYPYNPGVGDVGWTEGWVTFNSAWNAALAWYGTDDIDVWFGTTDGERVDQVQPDATVTIGLRAPLSLDDSDGNSGTVRVNTDDEDSTSVTVSPRDAESAVYEADLNLTAIEADPGDEITVTYGHGVFAVEDSIAVDPYDIAFDDVPGRVTSGRTVPIRFTVMDDGKGVSDLDLTVTVTPPSGEERAVEYKTQADGRYHVNVDTSQEGAGEYVVTVADPDGDEIGSLAFTARAT